MVDRNKNGIDDSREGFGVQTFNGPAKKPAPAATSNARPSGIAGAWQDFLQGPVRGVSNFAGDLGLFLASKPIVPGRSAGDQMYGVPQRPEIKKAAALPNRMVGSPAAAGAEAKQQSLLDFLSQAGSIVDQLGIGGASGGSGGIDYSGAMADARNEAATNRGHISGIYNQLRQGLEGDRAGIATNFGGAIDRSQDIAQVAQDVTRQAYDAAAAKQDQAANALGMQSAAASQQLDRPTTQQLAADAIGDSAAYAQNAQTQYNSQQANETAHSSRVQDASRFSEARAQGELDQSLTDRLTELAQLQAQQQAQAATDTGARGSAILSLAQQLYGDAGNQSQQDFENELATIKAVGGQQSSPQYTLAQLMQGQEQSGLNTQDYLSFMKLLNGLNS